MTETMARGYSSVSTQRVPYNEYQHDRVWMGGNHVCGCVLYPNCKHIYCRNAEYSQKRTHVPGFQSYFSFFLHHFVSALFATSGIGVKCELHDTKVVLGCRQGISRQFRPHYNKPLTLHRSRKLTHATWLTLILPINWSVPGRVGSLYSNIHIYTFLGSLALSRLEFSCCTSSVIYDNCNEHDGNNNNNNNNNIDNNIIIIIIIIMIII